MTKEEKNSAKAFYFKRMAQNKVGDEDLNGYMDNRFGDDTRDCDSGGIRRRVDVFRLDEKPELAFYMVVLEEKGASGVIDDDDDDDFGTFRTEEIYNSPETEWGGTCGDGEYVCRISLVTIAELKTIAPRLVAILGEYYDDLMVVGL